MNWGEIQVNWKQVTEKAKAQWGKLTDQSMDVIASRSNQFSEQKPQPYATAKVQAEKRVRSWLDKDLDTWLTDSNKPASARESTSGEHKPDARVKA